MDLNKLVRERMELNRKRLTSLVDAHKEVEKLARQFGKYRNFWGRARGGGEESVQFSIKANTFNYEGFKQKAQSLSFVKSVTIDGELVEVAFTKFA